MKKLIGIAALVMVLAVSMTACGKFECDICSKEKSGKKHKGEVAGESVVYCDECYKELEELKNALS